MSNMFSQIAIAAEPNSNAGASVLTSDWNQNPSWLLPPPLYQPYCVFHFLKECSLYHLRQSESLKLATQAHEPTAKKPSKWPTKPTRVQPTRRAREKNWKGCSGVSTDSRDDSPHGSEIDAPSIETRLQQLQLHTPWPVYKTQLENRIKQISHGIPSEGRGESGYELCLACRYCRFIPETIDRKGSGPRNLAPPAPMYFIQPDEIRNEQISKFGGLNFAVDVSSGLEIIILLGIEKVEDIVQERIVRGRTGSPGSKKSIEKPGPVRATKSRIRSR